METARNGPSHNSLSCDVCRGISRNLPIWMSEVQLAHYWVLFDKDSKPLIGEIRDWPDRACGHRLPYARMGDHRRFHRSAADNWAWDGYELEGEDDHESAPSPEGDLPN